MSCVVSRTHFGLGWELLSHRQRAVWKVSSARSIVLYRQPINRVYSSSLLYSFFLYIRSAFFTKSVSTFSSLPFSAPPKYLWLIHTFICHIGVSKSWWERSIFSLGAFSRWRSLFAMTDLNSNVFLCKQCDNKFVIIKWSLNVITHTVFSTPTAPKSLLLC